MSTFVDQISEKSFIPNVVIKIDTDYFAIRQPDSGLVIPDIFKSCVAGFTLSSTKIDRLDPATSTSQNSFKLLDREGVITNLFGQSTMLWQGKKVEAWLGRSNVNMDFSEYLKLTDTYISKASRVDGSYSFSTKESKDRLNSNYFNRNSKLGASIVASTTVITLQTPPLETIGYIKINDEFISYNGIIGNNLQNCIRGEFNSLPADHNFGSDVFFVTPLVDKNPINILLEVLISSGGGGPYDVLGGGAGLDQSLIDVAQFEEIRDEFFLGQKFTAQMYDISNLRSYLEQQILMPCGLRLRTNFNGKIGLATLNNPILNIDAPDINHDRITKSPNFSIEENKIYNRIQIDWDYQDTNKAFNNVSYFEDTASIAEFGASEIRKFGFQCIKNDVLLEGQALINKIGGNFLKFFAYPRPTIDTNAHMSLSQWSLGEQPFTQSNQIPTENGDLNFADTLELVEKSINVQTGDVKLKLQFNQFTGLRVCYIAPSDLITQINSQKSIEIGAGRGDNYRRGWKIKLFNRITNTYEPDPVNEIKSINGDQIEFVNNFLTTLTLNHRIKFADYDEVTETQKRFCFVGCGPKFDDGKGIYKIYCS